ncbi:predicted protein [Chaetoceros tenuissimus]|uniref:Uncharacterized protein n=1 Tax=Chaetoceros tenuissimus TaxID=426638 RepID=A0AAD3H2K1_9STRA|nr:predicted protein [Chaetoceros tenuissimus]
MVKLMVMANQFKRDGKYSWMNVRQAKGMALQKYLYCNPRHLGFACILIDQGCFLVLTADEVFLLATS